MRVLIPGGSGQVGTLLARSFHADGHHVTVLSREARPAPWRVVAWDGATLGDWTRELDGVDVLINLSGRSVNCRYTEANRRAILDSRVETTQLVGAAVANVRRPPALWLQASTATIYAHRHDAPNDEDTGLIGGAEPGAPASWRFSVEVASAWEKAAADAAPSETRLVQLRSAVILSPDRGGIFDTLLTLVRHGLGGTAGNGRQWVSWVHDADFIGAVSWLIDRKEISGIVNIASPNPVPNAEFMRTLREEWGTRIGLAANRMMLEIGAFLMRTETELVLKSRRVVPRRLLDSGFRFSFPVWRQAARDLCRRVRHQEAESGEAGSESRHSEARGKFGRRALR